MVYVGFRNKFFKNTPDKASCKTVMAQFSVEKMRRGNNFWNSLELLLFFF
jgi:hypothetical protein